MKQIARRIFPLPRPLGRLLASRRGSLTVEYVVIMPIFLVALAFAFEFGQVFIAHQSVENNVRSAVRYLSRSSLSASDRQVAVNIIRNGDPGNSGAGPDYLECDPSADCIRITNEAWGRRITVRARINYQPRLFQFFGPDGVDFIRMAVTEDARHAGV